MKFFMKIKNNFARKKKATLKPSFKNFDDSVNERKDLRGRYCDKPFTFFEMSQKGRVYACCPSWLFTRLGNLENSTPEEIWNSEAAQAIRASILDGSFSYCNHKICPVIQNDSLPTTEEAAKDPRVRDIIENQRTVLNTPPNFFNFCNDSSCNLSCPSCRTEKILVTEGPQFDITQKSHQSVVDAFMKEPTKRHFTINVTGSGDPFASRVFRDFLFSLDGADFPNMRVNLQTNAVLFTRKNWEKLRKVHNNLNTILISFDASTPETYAVTRRGGNWGMLLENVQYISEARKQNKFRHLRLDFVVQQDNYKDMPGFVELSKKFGVDVAYFSSVVDWGTWPKEVYEQKSIWKQNHPEFQEFLSVLRHPVFDDPIVDLGNISEIRRYALELVSA